MSPSLTSASSEPPLNLSGGRLLFTVGHVIHKPGVTPTPFSTSKKLL